MTTTATSTDRIEKNIQLRAPRSRVWRALTDAEEFGAWFRVKLEGGFAPGRTVTGKILYPGFEHLTLEMRIEEIVAEVKFSYRWHPYATDTKVDYSSEPMTLVEFHLKETPEGTHLSVVESGFDRIPESRRAEAFRMNSGGWVAQMENIQRHVDG
ncbi:MAG: SRPBCC family protein [Polyangiaceae bacterium]|nr:SRPBCC family protein [Polyangiaceae bacterium]